MATGATGDYWEQQALPRVYKHALLRRYIPVFGGKTGSTSGEVIILDGFAGRGRHSDGTPGSAELILKTAVDQSRITWRCFFFENDSASHKVLQGVIDEYVELGVAAISQNSEVAPHLPEVLSAAQGLPLFMFLDPCGLGLPYETLVQTLNAPDRAGNPTEALLNFSMEAVRRIGGHVLSPKGNERTLSRLDEVVGGNWWRTIFESGEPNPDEVVTGFMRGLARDTKMKVGAFPVRRAPHHQPLYYLVFATRSNHGFWAISDAAAKAAEEWRNAHANSQQCEGTLFDIGPATTRARIESDAVSEIASNIERMLNEKESFKVLDHPLEILGKHVGEVRNLCVREAVKRLYRQGKTACTGVGPLVEQLVVTRPGPS